MTETTHTVFAKLRAGGTITVRDGKDLSWDDAQARWRELDDARRVAQLPLVDYLVVRESNDPQWVGATIGHKSFTTVTTGTIYKTRVHAAKAFVRDRPEWEGRAGGWIYQNGRPVTQGYWNLGDLLAARSLIIPIGDGRYAVAARVAVPA